MNQLNDYGWNPALLPADTKAIPARITAVHRERYELVCDEGVLHGQLRAGTYFNGTEQFPTAGDFVLIDSCDGESCRILQTLPRRSLFTRLDPSSAGHGAQAVAANFDYVFIMQSLNHDFNPRRLERYLTLAWQSGAVPVVLLTKADLVDDCTPQLREAERLAAGAAVYAVSAQTGKGLDALSVYLQPRKTIVFLGSSGVGKSSLVNALAGEAVMAVNEIREDDSRGRHTTTHRQLILLQSGVMIIDTPGMRALGMWDVTEGLGQSFADVEDFLGHCRFHDCCHETEPGCAIRAAIASGALSQERWDSYRNLKNEAKYAEDKQGYLREKDAWHKAISITNKKMQKQRGQKR